MRRRIIISTCIVTIAGLAAAFLWLRRPAVAPTVGDAPIMRDAAPQENAHETASDSGLSAQSEPADQPATLAMETVIAPPLPYFPPPNTDLTGGTLGRQRIESTKDIGDIYRLYFHAPTFMLYMAVVEPDGMRSIWRLDEFGRSERVFAANTNSGEIRLFGDSSGAMYVQYNNPKGMVRTSDQFKTWYDVRGAGTLFWGMADDGYVTVYGTLHDYNSALLYRSPDNGFSWEPWVDFQKVFPEDAVQYDPADPRFRLRHLHDIIYNQRNGDVIVGTGDVARYTVVTHDDGRTWEKIWDEGFTAHTVVSGGNRYLLCPDRLQKAGIALYDATEGTVREVFRPAAYGYAGYCYSIINVDGIYYAALHTEANEATDVVPKFGIVVSPDAETWYPFLEWGPLGSHARTDIWLASAPGAVYASVNGALYSFRPLDREWFADKTPFSER